MATASSAAEAAKPLTPFEVMDRHALAAPAAVTTSSERLASYLCGPAKNPYEKVRAIFRWITANIDYDIDTLLAGQYPPFEADRVLERRKAVCAGYSRLFEKLCQEAGIEAAYVTGHCREYGEETNERLRTVLGGEILHAWNAVKLGGQWHLLDATWGAGYIDEEGRFARRFNPHYFLTRPVELIHTHYPEEPKWQLLPQPVARNRYDQLVHVRSGFFRNGLTLMNHRLMSIPAAGPVTVTVGTPEDVVLSARLEGKRGETLAGRTLAQRRGKAYEILVCPPANGLYHLLIYARKKSESMAPWALGYQVQAAGIKQQCPDYPVVFGTFGDRDVTLIAPLAARLPALQAHLFRLTVPGANRVFGAVGGERFDLERLGNQFSGGIAAPPGELIFYAEFPGESVYQGLLKYVVE